MDQIDQLKLLAGITVSTTDNNVSGISLTANEKSKIMREHNIKPGSQEWFRLWFSKPHLTGETPIKTI